jgi:hypothetical protein
VGYLFMLHVPLSFGGLSLVSSIVHKPDLDPLTMVYLCSIFVFLLPLTKEAYKVTSIPFFSHETHL